MRGLSRASLLVLPRLEHQAIGFRSFYHVQQGQALAFEIHAAATVRKAGVMRDVVMRALQAVGYCGLRFFQVVVSNQLLVFIAVASDLPGLFFCCSVWISPATPDLLMSDENWER
jgi:hypothetical protein